MAVVQKNKACEDYSNEYLLLTDTKKNTFARLCNGNGKATYYDLNE